MAWIEQRRRRFVVIERIEGVKVKGPSYAERADAELFVRLVGLVGWQAAQAFIITRSWSFPPTPPSDQKDTFAQAEFLSRRPLKGDVAVTRTEMSGNVTYGAIVLGRGGDGTPLPSGTRRLIRLRDGNFPLSPETVAAAINAVVTKGWPQGTRGDLDFERATSYIRVPLAQAGELGLEAALNLKESMEPLLSALADPSTWT